MYVYIRFVCTSKNFKSIDKISAYPYTKLLTTVCSKTVKGGNLCGFDDFSHAIVNLFVSVI